MLRSRFRTSLSAKLLALTILFVLLAEILIYLPSIVDFRREWLQDRVAAAQTAALVFQASPEGDIRPEVAKSLLRYVGAFSISLKRGDIRWLIAADENIPPIDVTYDLRSESGFRSLAAAFETLAATKERTLRILNNAPTGGVEFIEIIMPEAPLKQAMATYSRAMIIMSLWICGMAAALLYFTLHIFFIRPLKNLSASMINFRENPEDPTRITSYSGRHDEIGEAEQTLGEMQHELQAALRQKTHLAALGLAVAKINHDLRNILSPVQLFADRLAELPDPNVQHFMPKILSALDRAIAMCQNTLAYGKALEPAPEQRLLPLKPLVEDVTAILNFGSIKFENEVPDTLQIYADPEQLFRILLNLLRNSLQALGDKIHAPGAAAEFVRVRAHRTNGTTYIDVIDSGPGVSPTTREKLFQPFATSRNAGGAGLGLAIAAELARGHGGTIELKNSNQGAHFEIVLPDAPKKAPARKNQSASEQLASP